MLRRRPDLIAAERRLAAPNAQIGVAIAEYYPKLSLSGLVGSATAVSSGNLFTSGASQAAGVLGLRWRLFDFGRIDAQIDLAKGRDVELLAGYRLAVLRATEDVENSFSTLVKREEQASVLAMGVDSLGRARGASFAAYQKGIVSLIEVLQADDNLLRASDARAQAQTESARAAVAAFKALGGGWQPTTRTRWQSRRNLPTTVASGARSRRNAAGPPVRSCLSPHQSHAAHVGAPDDRVEARSRAARSCTPRRHVYDETAKDSFIHALRMPLQGADVDAFEEPVQRVGTSVSLGQMNRSSRTVTPCGSAAMARHQRC